MANERNGVIYTQAPEDQVTVMTDFNKLKIGFALALLAALFALNPIITSLGNLSYQLFSLNLKLIYAYWTFAILLGISVYFYAIALIGIENSFFDFTRKLGNFAYAFALFVPPIFFFLYAVSVITVLFTDLLKHPSAARIIEITFSALIGAFASVGIRIFFKLFSKRDRSEKVQSFSKQESDLLTRSRKLLNENYYDISVSEAWKAIEVALRKAFYNLGIQEKEIIGSNLIERAERTKMISSLQAENLQFIRKMRNDAVHTEVNISKDDAQKVIKISDKVIASLDKITERCYYCNSEYQISSLESDDFTGAFVCKSCSDKHPNWKDELAEMGMSP